MRCVTAVLVAAVAAAAVAHPLFNLGGHAELRVMAEGFDAPMAVVATPSDDVLVAQMNGSIYLVDFRTGIKTLFLDLAQRLPFFVHNTAKSLGLFNLLLHPETDATGGMLYLSYTTAGPNFKDASPKTCAERVKTDISYYHVLSEWQVEIIGNSIEVFFVRDLARAAQPPLPAPPVNFNDHGGALAFGGGMNEYVYWGRGNDGCNDAASDPQDKSNMHGKIVKVDLNTGKAVVAAVGLKNPFSAITRAGEDGEPVVYISDCGAGQWEEVNIMKDGANFGFPKQNGPDCADPKDTKCGAGVTPPIAMYNRRLGGSCITSLLYYSGAAFPCLHDRLVLSDLYERNYTAEWESGAYRPTLVGALKHAGSANAPAWENEVLDIHFTLPHGLKTAVFLRLGQDAHGEILIVASDNPNGANGRILKVVSAGNPEESICATPDMAEEVIAATRDKIYDIVSALHHDHENGTLDHHKALVYVHELRLVADAQNDACKLLHGSGREKCVTVVRRLVAETRHRINSALRDTKRAHKEAAKDAKADVTSPSSSEESSPESSSSTTPASS